MFCSIVEPKRELYLKAFGLLLKELGNDDNVS